MTPTKTRADRIRGTVSDLVSDFLYYDRKEDEDLPRGAIQDAIAANELTADNLVGWFREELTKGLARERDAGVSAALGACQVCDQPTASRCSDCTKHFGQVVPLCGKRSCREEHNRRKWAVVT